MAMPRTLVGYHTSQPATAVVSRLRKLRSAWMRRVSRQRLARSIAHLDDRLLADIGLGRQDLRFAERVARSRAAGGGIWAGSKTGPGIDWQ
jgi:uncharacterized protein YjiS (DUF1127 family)